MPFIPLSSLSEEEKQQYLSRQSSIVQPKTSAETPSQAGQQAHQENKFDLLGTVTSPIRQVMSGAANVAGSIGDAAQAINPFSKDTMGDRVSHMGSAVQKAATGVAQVATSPLAPVVEPASYYFNNPNKAEDQVNSHAQNLSYTSSNPSSFFTEDLPTAIANVSLGARKMLGGAYGMLQHGKDTIANTFSGKDTSASSVDYFKSINDMISGGMQVLSSPAPLLPDPIEKGVGDAFGVVPTLAKNISTFLIEKTGHDPMSPEGQMLTQTAENLANVFTAINAPKVGKSIAEKTKSATTTIAEEFAKNKTPESLSQDGAIQTSTMANNAAIDAAKEFNIDAPAPVINRSYVVNAIHSFASKGLFGSDLVNEAIKFKAGIHDELLKMKDSINKAGNLQDVGNQLIQSFNKMEEGLDARKNQAFQTISAKTQGVPIDHVETMSTLENTMDLIRKSHLPNELDTKLQNMYNSMKEGTTFDRLSITRTDLGATIKNAFNDPVVSKNVGLLKRIYGAMTKDLETAAGTIEPGFQKVFKDANSLHEQYVQNLKGYIGSQFDKVEDITKITGPENLFDKFIKPETYSHISDITDMLGEDGAASLKAGLILKGVEFAGGEHNFSPTKFATFLDKYDKAARNLFTDAEYHRLQQAKTLGDAFKKVEKLSEGSQTAYLTGLSTAASLGAAAVGGIMSGNAIQASVPLIAYVVANKGAVKFFSSEVGKTMLQQNLGDALKYGVKYTRGKMPTPDQKKTK